MKIPQNGSRVASGMNPERDHHRHGHRPGGALAGGVLGRYGIKNLDGKPPT
jgi:hypothetical protein